MDFLKIKFKKCALTEPLYPSPITLMFLAVYHCRELEMYDNLNTLMSSTNILVESKNIASG